MERTILSHLVYNEKYARKVKAYLRPEYFHDESEKAVFNVIDGYIEKYNGLPTKEALKVEFDELTLNQQVYEDGVELINSIKSEPTDYEWLIDNTEKFCKNRAIHNAIMDSISIIDGSDQKRDVGVLPDLLRDALAVSFDTSVGHDFIEDAESRFEYYREKTVKLPFDLDIFNKITKGGLKRKSLTVVMAATGGGKSIFMCHAAANNLSQGKNVLYITLEMSEEEISKRIDANLLNIPIADLETVDKSVYIKKVEKLRGKTNGKLIIKEFPASSASTSNIRHTLNELKLKKNFVPDIIYVDYINLLNSARAKFGANINSYTLIKLIAEELRGISTEFNLPVVTATQVNRNGMNNTDIELTDTSESIGLPQTADLMFALINTEELEQLGQLLVKQLKNRYNDLNYYRKFTLGIDKRYMRLYDVDQKVNDIIDENNHKDDDEPVFNKSKFGVGMDPERKSKIKSLFNE